jgi:hypothetical protein
VTNSLDCMRAAGFGNGIGQLDRTSHHINSRPAFSGMQAVIVFDPRKAWSYTAALALARPKAARTPGLLK